MDREHACEVLQLARRDYLEKKWQFTDVTLICDDKEFKAHRVILASFSPFFASTLQNEDSSSNQDNARNIYLNFVTASAMECWLLFMYTGLLQPMDTSIVQLLQAADRLKIEKAVQILKQLESNRSELASSVQDIEANIVEEKENAQGHLSSMDDTLSFDGDVTDSSKQAVFEDEFSEYLSDEDTFEEEDSSFTIETFVESNTADPIVIIPEQRVEPSKSYALPYFDATEDENVLKCKLCNSLVTSPNGSTLLPSRHLEEKHQGIRKRKRRHAKKSRVWNYFTEDESNFETARCNFCQEYVPRHRGTTTKMYSHLRRCHRRIFEMEKSQTPCTSLGTGQMHAARDNAGSSLTCKKTLDEQSCLDVTDAENNEFEVITSDEQSSDHKKRDDKKSSTSYSRNKKKLGSTPRTVSKLWDYFTATEDRKFARCKFCAEEVKRPWGTTTYMKYHMSKKHPNISRDLYVNVVSSTDRHSANTSSGLAGTSDEENRRKKYKSPSQLGKWAKKKASNPTKTMSKCWLYFKRTSMERDCKARCTLCNIQVNRPLSSTANMRNHLEKYHLELNPAAYDGKCLASEEPIEVTVDTDMENNEIFEHNNIEQNLPQGFSSRKENDEWKIGILEHLHKSSEKETDRQADLSLWQYYEQDPNCASNVICNFCGVSCEASELNRCQHLLNEHWNIILREHIAKRRITEGKQAEEESNVDSESVNESGSIDDWTSNWLSMEVHNPLQVKRTARVWLYFNESAIKECHLKTGFIKCSFCDTSIECKEHVTKVMSTHLKGEHMIDLFKDIEKETNGTLRFKNDFITNYEEMLYFCEDCELSATFNDVIVPEKESQIDLENTCLDCGTTYSTSEGLKKHIVTIHPEIQLLSCDWNGCNAKFTSIKQKEVHWKRRHELFMTFECNEDGCNFETHKKLEILRHKRIHHPIYSPQNESCICHICGNVFASKATLKSHLDALHANEVFQCADCSFSTHQKYTFTTHMKRVHYKNIRGKRIEPFRCDQCPTYITFKKSRLHAHIATVHTKEKNFKCPECDFTTASKYTVKMHMLRRHKKQQFFSCHLCGMKANLLVDMKKHLMSRHGAHKYGCEHCSKTFKLTSELALHLVTHGDYKNVCAMHQCPDCEYKSPVSTKMANHIARVHGKDRREFLALAQEQMRAYLDAKKSDKFKANPAVLKPNIDTGFFLNMKTKEDAEKAKLSLIPNETSSMECVSFFPENVEDNAGNNEDSGPMIILSGTGDTEEEITYFVTEIVEEEVAQDDLMENVTTLYIDNTDKKNPIYVCMDQS